MSRPTLYIIWLLKIGHERCHAGMCTWADVLNDDRYRYDVMIDLISYHDAWSVPRVSFHDRCISIAFTTPSSDLRWKCNIDFPLRRYYFSTADVLADELQRCAIRLGDDI